MKHIYLNKFHREHTERLKKHLLRQPKTSLKKAMERYETIKRSSSRGVPKMDSRLADAITRGELVRQKLAADEGGSISTRQAARLLGVTVPTVLRRWRRHRLIAWSHSRSVRVPVWQFAGRKMLEGIEEVLQIFRSDEQWRVMMYFLRERIELDRRRPLDLLREGKAAEVIDNAKAHADPQENTW